MNNSTMEPVVSTPADHAQLTDRVTNTGFDLVRLAIEKGMPQSDITKLVDMGERIRADSREQAFNRAMLQAQREMPVVAKTTKGQNKMYANLESIERLCKPVWMRNGITLSFSQGEAIEQGMLRIVCDVSHEGGHTRQRWIELPPDGIGPKGNPSGMSPVQARGSTLSYAERYLTCKLFNIVIADEDNDGSGPCITSDQIAELNTAIEKKVMDFPKFLEYLQIESLDRLPASRFGHAMYVVGTMPTRKTKEGGQ
jgi:hypothetical protein